MCVCVVCLQLNNIRSHLTSTNQRLAALSAELSLKRARALSQQQEIKEKELQVRGGLVRLQRIPCSHDCVIHESKLCDLSSTFSLSVSHCLSNLFLSLSTDRDRSRQSVSKLNPHCVPSFTSNPLILLICTVKINQVVNTDKIIFIDELIKIKKKNSSGFIKMKKCQRELLSRSCLPPPAGQVTGNKAPVSRSVSDCVLNHGQGWLLRTL